MIVASSVYSFSLLRITFSFMRKHPKSQRIEQGKALWFVCVEEIAFFQRKTPDASQGATGLGLGGSDVDGESCAA